MQNTCSPRVPIGRPCRAGLVTDRVSGERNAERDDGTDSVLRNDSGGSVGNSMRGFYACIMKAKGS